MAVSLGSITLNLSLPNGHVWKVDYPQEPLFPVGVAHPYWSGTGLAFKLFELEAIPLLETTFNGNWSKLSTEGFLIIPGYPELDPAQQAIDIGNRKLVAAYKMFPRLRTKALAHAAILLDLVGDIEVSVAVPTNSIGSGVPSSPKTFAGTAS